MNNKYVYMIVAAIVGFVAHKYVQGIEQIGDTETWMYGMIFAIALGAGSTGGSDVVSILVEGITGYINTIILFVIFGTVYTLLMGMNFTGDGIIGAVLAGVTLAVSALFTNITVSYLRKAA